MRTDDVSIVVLIRIPKFKKKMNSNQFTNDINTFTKRINDDCFIGFFFFCWLIWENDGYLQSTMVKFSTWFLNFPFMRSTNVCGVMHFKSWCLPAVNGRAKGRVKSPIKSGSSVATKQTARQKTRKQQQTNKQRSQIEWIINENRSKNQSFQWWWITSLKSAHNSGFCFRVTPLYPMG